MYVCNEKGIHTKRQCRQNGEVDKDKFVGTRRCGPLFSDACRAEKNSLPTSVESFV